MVLSAKARRRQRARVTFGRVRCVVASSGEAADASARYARARERIVGVVVVAIVAIVVIGRVGGATNDRRVGL